MVETVKFDYYVDHSDIEKIAYDIIENQSSWGKLKSIRPRIMTEEEAERNRTRKYKSSIFGNFLFTGLTSGAVLMAAKIDRKNRPLNKKVVGGATVAVGTASLAGGLYSAKKKFEAAKGYRSVCIEINYENEKDIVQVGKFKVLEPDGEREVKKRLDTLVREIHAEISKTMKMIKNRSKTRTTLRK